MSAIKLKLMEIAATLTAGVMANCPDTIPISEDLNEEAKTANALAASVYVSFYDYVCRAYQDERVFLSPPEPGNKPGKPATKPTAG